MTDSIQILVGTTSGNTEFLADEAAEWLTQQGVANQVHYEPDLNKLNTTQPWLIFLASHGGGEYADSMLDFYDQIQQQKQLPNFPYAVVAIGESCYDTFCSAGRDLDERLQKLGAKRVYQRLEIDMLQDDPEEKVSTWLPSWIDALRSYTQKGS